MLLQRLLQLIRQVALRTLAEQVERLASAFVYPINRGGAIHEAQHFHALQHASLSRPSADGGDGILFAVGHAG